MGRTDRLRDFASEHDLFRVRATVAGALVVVLLLGLTGRLYVLQHLDHVHYTTLSEDNRVRLQPVPPTRGLILDRNGEVLARNEPTFSLQLVPEQIADLDHTLEELGGLVEFDERALARFLENWRRARSFESIPLRFRLTADEVARLSVNLHRFPGVNIVAGLSREYPHGETGAHVIGYVGRIDERDMLRIDRARYRGTNHIGKIGVESRYEPILHGQPGYRRVEVNVQGRVLRILEEESPIPGRDVHLTIDLGLQRVAEEALAGRAGAAVALDPRTGEILALASVPSFDPSLFVHGIDHDTYAALRDAPYRPLFNRALRGQYSPGSTIKPAIAVKALDTGVQTRDEIIECRGYYRLPGGTRRYRDWRVHGPLDLAESVTRSCNVTFYELAHRMGIDTLAGHFRAFGLGAATGIDLPGERAGLVPDPEWKRRTRGEPWHRGETIIHGIGQGFLNVTPLQLAGMTALFANRGEPVRPHVFRDAEGVGLEPLRSEDSVIPPISLNNGADWEYIIDSMVEVTRGEHGTARSLGWRSPDLVIAGKTGTSQVFGLPQDEEVDQDDLPEQLRDHGLFIAFSPADEPEIAVAVLVEHGGGGASSAAPVAHDIIAHWLRQERGHE